MTEARKAAYLSPLIRELCYSLDPELMTEFERTDGRMNGPNSQALLDRPLGSWNPDLHEVDEAQAMDVDEEEYQNGDTSPSLAQAQSEEVDDQVAWAQQFEEADAESLERLRTTYSAVGAFPFTPSAPEAASSADLLPKFAKGAIRITRTPNRQLRNTPNTIRLDEICRKESLQSMWMTSFLIAEAEIFPFLPFNGSGPHSQRDAPVYISREIDADMMRKVLAKGLGEDSIKPTVPLKDLGLLSPVLAGMYEDLCGKDCRMIYPWASGICHSKAMVIEYKECLLVCITSSNLMRIDLELGDNAYWIQTFPRLRPDQQHDEHETEWRLFDHMEALGAHDFLDRVREKFDFSACRVELFTSVPGTKKGSQLEEYGILRLAKLVREIVPSKEERKKLAIEVCAGSIGKLSPAWVAQALHFLTGGKPSRAFPMLDSLNTPQPATELTIVYPSVENVKRCDPDAIQAASNIGCSLNGTDYAGWLGAPSWIRSYFHEYISKDRGRLFHLKQLIWLSPSTSSTSPPPLIAFGSANFSQAALGVVERLRNGEAKITMNNFELGVVVRGKDWVEMLERGSQWEDGITYKRAAPRYASGAKPWNSPAWTKKAGEEL
ncbi:tyrosyl-DNA phosphodiesterase-domain-containing protein [Leucosporidium creatinivorum]|uniref:Tyrosyl-DNA phosphodiesterase-domain-containing protein n=1 Tax=Leucosporidium creatinivorum TaxID=106004 RepID=A0A1Y2FX18_9BASI|nr:tyrosyl-DNA phosphodiesterase-domain-containing protein [Leucosporidium creatinivorum]